MRERREGGAVIVEAALVFPLVFILISGLIDLGYWAYENAQVANAARDGARVAILDFVTTAPPSTADGTFSSTDVLPAGSAQQLIQAAIASHLGGRAFTAQVACYAAGTTTPVSGGCANAAPGSDEVSVTVTTARPSFSFIGPKFGSSSITETSTLVVVGEPQAASAATTTTPTSSTTTTTTGACSTPTIGAPTSGAPFTIKHNQSGSVTITGTNFQSGLSVASDGFSSVTITSVTSTQITATVNATNARGTYSLMVTNPCGSSATSAGSVVVGN